MAINSSGGQTGRRDPTEERCQRDARVHRILFRWHTTRAPAKKGGFSSEQSVAVAQFIESSEDRGRVGLDAEEGQALAIWPARVRMGARFS